jgi:hypothetical protein
MKTAGRKKYFAVIGRRVANEVANGKRWGAEVPLPK